MKMMKLLRLPLLLFSLLLGLWFVASASGKQLLLRPLNAAQIRELLQQQELEPEGRSIRNGLAALTGYTLGLSKALLGIFIYDVITANVTDLETATVRSYAKEVCFNPRTLETLPDDTQRSNYNPYDDVDVDVGDEDNVDDDAGADADDVYDDLDRQLDTVTTSSSDSADATIENSNVATCIVLFRNR